MCVTSAERSLRVCVCGCARMCVVDAEVSLDTLAPELGTVPKGVGVSVFGPYPSTRLTLRPPFHALFPALASL